MLSAFLDNKYCDGLPKYEIIVGNNKDEVLEELECIEFNLF